MRLREVASCWLLGASLALTMASAEKRVIHPPEFPTGRPFSTGLLVDDTLYISGQIGADLKTGQIPEDFEAEVRQCLENIGLVLKAAGMSFADAVSVQVYLTDMSLFPRMNAVYVKYFPEPRPTRTTVGVASLVGKARIEITVTARRAGARTKP
ncbi:MAG: RidA family protein [Bryobacterales bacterium]|nr:RidA family protein [Bryobacterales bacterium]